MRWVRVPLQERTRRGLTRMLDAAETLIGKRGFEEASIAEIAKQAGSSIGGFYRRFRDKERLLYAMHERFCEEARATGDAIMEPAQWHGATLAQILAAFTAFLVQIYREREGLLRAFLHHAVTDATVRGRTDELHAHLSRRLLELVEERRDEIRHPDAAVAIGFGLRVVTGTLNSTLLLPATALGLSDERLAAELARVFTTYLGVADA